MQRHIFTGIIIPLLLLGGCSNNKKESKVIEPLKIFENASSGFYDKPFYLSFTSNRDCTIYYTLDNKEPTKDSLKYESPILIDNRSEEPNYYSIKEDISSIDVYKPSINVDKGTIVKAIAIDKDGKTSNIINNTYFVGLNNNYYKDLPVMCLSIDEDDLFDYYRGIYVKGYVYDHSEHEGYPEAHPANYTQKGKAWERKCHLTYLNSDKLHVFSQDIGVRIHGGWSRCFNQKSFNLYAREDYSGSSYFSYPFFNDIGAHTLMLRSGGYRDTTLTKVRDSLDQDMVNEEKFANQDSMPVITFLNGEYWGIYNLQERFTDDYVQEHYGVNKNNVLVIKNDELDEGNKEDFHYYTELKEFFLNNDFSNSEKYLEAKNYINDMEEFSSYMATQLYINNIDWPGNNVRMWMDVNKKDGWHFMMYDTDDSSNILPSKCSVSQDPFLNSAHWKSGPLDESCILGLILSRLIQNEEFKALFKTIYQRIGGNNFAYSKVEPYLNKKENLLKTPMVYNYLRFVSDDIITYNEQYYVNQINIIKEFFKYRYEYAIEYLNLHIS